MDEKEKIYLLLEEYRAVRADLAQLRARRHRLASVSGIVLLVALGLATFFGALGTGVALIILLVVLASVAFSELYPRIEAARSRLMEIEAEINRRAEERLFVWETDRRLYRQRFGAGVLGTMRERGWPNANVGAHFGRLGDFMRARASAGPPPPTDPNPPPPP